MDEGYPNLKKFDKRSRSENENFWSIDNIRAGLKYFIDKNQRYPSAREIDHFEYLPASRTIQRRFGGLEKLRTELGLPVAHFGKGESRSKIALYANKRGLESENKLYEALKTKFGEPFVHLERPYGSSKKRLDFYVFSPSGNFGVDIFYPNDLFTMGSNLNQKISLYQDFTQDNYLVVANIGISEEQIKKAVANKKKLLPKLCKVLSLSSFLEEVKNKKSYRFLE